MGIINSVIKGLLATNFNLFDTCFCFPPMIVLFVFLMTTVFEGYVIPIKYIGPDVSNAAGNIFIEGDDDVGGAGNSGTNTIDMGAWPLDLIPNGRQGKGQMGSD